jgi:hypothetical protein
MRRKYLLILYTQCFVLERGEAQYYQEFVLNYGEEDVTTSNQETYIATIRSKLNQAASDLRSQCVTSLGSSLTPGITVEYVGFEYTINVSSTFKYYTHLYTSRFVGHA